MTTITLQSNLVEEENWKQQLEEGLDFILGHFPKNEPLWPRRIMTKVLVDLDIGQRTVYDKDTALSYFEGAFGKDCRIAAYPYIIKKEEKEEEGELLLNRNCKRKVSILFVDLDLQDYNNNERELNTALQETLQNINKYFINSAEPTILWTGGGYHVYLPLDDESIPIFEESKYFEAYMRKAMMSEEDIQKQLLSVKFLRYAKNKLTNHRADKNHNPSFESFLLRVPNSINSKYEGQQRTKVKIVQRWNGIRAKPTEQFMLSDFRAYLIQELLDEKVKQVRIERERKEKEKRNKNQQRQSSNTIAWVEKLLQTPIGDYRKHTRDLILVPYLIVRRGMTDIDQIQNIVMKWADKCAGLRTLDPSRREFEKELRSRIYEVMEERIPHMGLEALKEKNLEIYQRLRQSSNDALQ